MNKTENTVLDERFQVGSLTKLVTTAVIMQLISEEKLHLDDKLNDWFPYLPNATEIDIEDLLRHRSGLPDFNGLPTLEKGYQSPEEILRSVAEEKPLFRPCTSWAYSNTGYIILGQIIERIEGMPFHEVVSKRVINPLSLSSTVIRHQNDGIHIVKGHRSNELVTTEDDYATAYAAGGMASNARDMVLLMHALMKGDLFPSHLFKEMSSSLAPMDSSGQFYYGMGVQYYQVNPGPGVMVGHNGGITGFNSMVAYVVADNLFIAVLSNDESFPSAAGLWLIIQRLQSIDQVSSKDC